MSRKKMLGLPLDEEEMKLLEEKFLNYKSESGMETENMTNWARSILLTYCRPNPKTKEEESLKTFLKNVLMDENFKKFWGMKDDARPV